MGFTEREFIFFQFFFEIKEKKINFKQYAVLNALVLRKLISEFISKRISIKWPNDLILKKKKFVEFYKKL